jgi:hypothetical protein
MTAKRFIIDEYFEIGSVVIDTENENVRFKHENKLSMKQCCDLLNELHEELEPIKKICEKYHIPLKDLPEILEEYIAYDNDDDW